MQEFLLFIGTQQNAQRHIIVNKMYRVHCYINHYVPFLFLFPVALLGAHEIDMDLKTTVSMTPDVSEQSTKTKIKTIQG